MSVKICLERGFESLAFEWGHDLRIAQQGEKSYVTFFTLRPPPDCAGGLLVEESLVAMC